MYGVFSSRIFFLEGTKDNGNSLYGLESLLESCDQQLKRKCPMPDPGVFVKYSDF